MSKGITRERSGYLLQQLFRLLLDNPDGVQVLKIFIEKPHAYSESGRNHKKMNQNHLMSHPKSLKQKLHMKRQKNKPGKKSVHILNK